MLFDKAIVKAPGKSVVDGIDDYADAGKPSYERQWLNTMPMLSCSKAGDRSHGSRAIRAVSGLMFC